jgi:rSAM/selenodomain-associated transferase 2
MISVVIPTLGERAEIERLLGELARETTAHEVIVVDGGSADGTPEVATRLGVRLLRSARGRGRQLALGARAARGDTLLFLHADSRFPAGGLARIADALAADDRVGGGNFRVVFDGGTGFDRWLTGFYRWFRARGLYYGDSGVFVRRELYEAIGGIRPIALMEDYDFTRRLERAGATTCISEPPLVTSSRRFVGRRRAAIVFGWLAIHALYHIGVSPDRLARIYDGRSA